MFLSRTKQIQWLMHIFGYSSFVNWTAGLDSVEYSTTTKKHSKITISEREMMIFAGSLVVNSGHCEVTSSGFILLDRHKNVSLRRSQVTVQLLALDTLDHLLLPVPCIKRKMLSHKGKLLFSSVTVQTLSLALWLQLLLVKLSWRVASPYKILSFIQVNYCHNN